MLREAVQDVKKRKYFYRDNFRFGVIALIVTLGVLLVQLLIVIFVELTLPQPDFYATNSAGFVSLLKPRSRPNDSSQALLRPDPPEERTIKDLPRL